MKERTESWKHAFEGDEQMKHACLLARSHLIKEPQ